MGNRRLLLAVSLIGASPGFAAVPIEETVQKAITSLDQINEIALEIQQRFWMLVPPQENPLYIHSDSLVRPVDWNSTGCLRYVSPPSWRPR
jgi:hypothetical protein